MIVWGDSHADALTPGVAAWGTARGYGVQQSTSGGCRPLVGVRSVIAPARVIKGCAPMNATVMRDIAATPDLKLIVLAARWPLYAQARPVYDANNSPRTWIEDLRGRRGRKASLDAALRQTLVAIRVTGTKARILIVGPVPELTFTPPLCLARKRLMGLDDSLCWTAPAASPLQRARAAEALIDRDVAGEPRVAVVRPAASLCRSGRCAVAADGLLLYFDDDHLSASGARRLAPDASTARSTARPRPGPRRRLRPWCRSP